ncbi:MAG: putative 2-aminoethylphosphonate ABC transporter ATP-binding protein [Thiotrichales bacterium]|nr:putative 2-aminoethylphosphonate ABC transporter ATP-binding protein [Thiotrichales bacterium]
MRSMPSNPSSNDFYLRIRRLTKKFGEFTALADISLDVLDGEFVCFLGPSGCGKTTLLRAIAGLDIQTAGTIKQAGADISALPPSERDFGIVFQSYALFPNMTAARNVAYGLESRRHSREEVRSRVRELLDLVGLPDQGDKYPAQLSGGQQQRIALARAIAMSPGLLLLDEPLSALDAKVRARLRLEVKALQRRLGITTIMVTHDQEEALTMADRIVVMNHGVIEQVGSPVEIYREPASMFVADFIGTMNFLAAEVTQEGAAGDGGIRTGAFALACDTSGHSPRERVTAAIRPEDIVLLDAGDSEATGKAGDPQSAGDPRSTGRAGDAGETRNADIAPRDGAAVDATVEYVEFLGAFARVELACNGERLRMDLPIAQVQRFDLTAGSAVRAMVPREAVRLYAGAPPDG